MYTIDDLRGKYVKAGTPEAEAFLDACEKIGVIWCDGEQPREHFPLYLDPLYEFICIFKDGKDTLSNEREPFDEERRMKLKPFTHKLQWSIYTNDKPLCELTDEQYGKMRRMHDAGMSVEWRSSAIGRWELLSTPTWNPSGIYRIKQKSERELLMREIHAALTLDGDERFMKFEDLPQHTIDSYDSFINKFKLVKDGE